MYTDLYLKFADEAEADSFLYTVTPSIEVDGVVTADVVITPNYQNIDTIGIIYFRQTDPDVPPVPETGWHVNVRLVDGEDADLFQPFTLQPQHPRRVWS
jgi:hypothetical protein